MLNWTNKRAFWVVGSLLTLNQHLGTQWNSEITVLRTDEIRESHEATAQNWKSGRSVLRASLCGPNQWLIHRKRLQITTQTLDLDAFNKEGNIMNFIIPQHEIMNQAHRNEGKDNAKPYYSPMVRLHTMCARRKRRKIHSLLFLLWALCRFVIN